MADYRQIHTCIWKDSWFIELPQEYKLLFIYLFSNERACLSGLYDLSLKVIAFEADLDLDVIGAGLERFTEDGKVYYEDGMVWVPTLLRHNARNLTSPKIQAHLKTLIGGTRDCPLKSRWIAYYNGLVPEQYRMDTVCIPAPESDSDHEHEHEHEHEQDVPTGAGAPPTTFPDWQKAIKESKNRPATLRWMCEVLYPGLDPPEYSYIGKVARKVGGAGRLADLLWQHSTHPPTGDLLAYIQGVAKRATGPPGGDGQTPAQIAAGLAREMEAEDG